MNIPQQVQAQSDRADELLKQASGKESPAGGAKPTAESLNAKPSDAVKPEETVEYWKQRFEVIQGKYNSEIKGMQENVNLLNSLKNQVRQLTGQLTESQNLIGQLQKQLTEKREPAPDTTDPLSVLTAEEREHLDAEGITGKSLEILAKMVRASGGQGQNQNLEEINRKLEEDREARQRDAVRTFWTELERLVPDWRDVNQSEAFIAWLDAQIPYTNQTRGQRLTAAQNSLDHQTCAQFFLDFKKEQPTMKPVIDPNKQIEPDTSVTHGDDPTKDRPKGKQYTISEVQQFYKDCSLGKYADREAERKAMDEDIIRANQEGRITQG